MIGRSNVFRFKLAKPDQPIVYFYRQAAGMDLMPLKALFALP
jgi:hypothetical protein